MKKSEATGKLGYPAILGYNSGMVANNTMANLLGMMALPIFTEGYGVSAATIGICLLIPRLWDAVTDPLMGHISDNTRSRWGRRRPWLVVGAILGSGLFALLWNPLPGLNETGLAIHFGIVATLLLTAYTVWSVPYFALGNEMTPIVEERTRLMAFRSFFVGIAGMMLPWAVKLSFLPQFGENEMEGARKVGLLFALLILLFGILPALIAREPASHRAQERLKIFRSLREALKNGPFLLIAGVYAIGQLGLNLVLPMAYFIGLYHAFEGDKAANATLFSVLGSVWALSSVLSSLFIAPLARRMNRKPALILGLGLMIVGSASAYFTFNQSMPYLVLISYILMAPGFSIVFALTSAMLADVCDYDEWKTGLRREGVFSSLFTLLYKAAVAIGGGLTGILITAAGIDTVAVGLDQTEAVYRLRLIFVLVPSACLVVGILLTILYPLTEERMREIKADLAT